MQSLLGDCRLFMSESRSCIVGITSSEYVAKIADLLPSNEGRQSLIYWLIRSIGIPQLCDLIPIVRLKSVELKRFHDSGFVDTLLRSRNDVDSELQNYNELSLRRLVRYFKDSFQKPQSEGSDSEVDTSDSEIAIEDSILSDDSGALEKFGIMYDCYVFPFMSDYVQLVAGSTVSTAEYVVRQCRHHINLQAQVVGINWYGGRHHCHKSKASGFCYVNDIVLGINVLRRHFSKVFYLDLDLHHGDGVETAFKFSSKVFTCSVHRYDVGFYPGTGSDCLEAKYANIPTKKGLSDSGLRWILQNIVLPLIKEHEPLVVVLQLGSDGLALDTHKEWNLTIKGYCLCVDYLLQKIECPAMIVGGGGYNHTETAKFCAFLTSTILGNGMDEEFIPEHPLLDLYQEDGFRFWTSMNSTASKMKDKNDIQYLEEMRASVLGAYNNKISY